MNDTITTTELIALVIRGGKKILCAALVCAVLLGAVQASVEIRGKDSELATKEEEEYYQELRRLEKTVAREEERLAERQEYLDNSLYMKLNPYDIYTTTISLAVADLDYEAVHQAYLEDVPVEYLTNKIVNYYLTLWNAADLPSVLGLPAYEAVAEKYVRELVSVTAAGDGGLTILAVGADAAQSEALASAAQDLLHAKQAAVAAGSYDHAFSLLGNTTKGIIDYGMATAQQERYDDLDLIKENIIDAKLKMRELSAPDSGAVAVIKLVIAGAFIGAVAACLWICLQGILGGKVLSSHQVERTFQLPILGSAERSTGLFVRGANAVAGERMWRDQTQALDYIGQRAKVLCAGKKILLTSTLPCAADCAAVQALTAAVGEEHVRFVADFLHDPDAVQSMAECEEVLLLEAVGRTKLSAVSAVVDAARRCGCPVSGFVLI
ncbi:MAG: hypothetical protein E7429_00365 [Ruminococcaceae bacterium]|nr:hypothetical protein [Oscillospiraceae bacterium]